MGEAVAASSATPTGNSRRAATLPLTGAAIGLLVLVGAAACTPQEMRAWWDRAGVDHSEMSDAEVQPWADAATAFWDAVRVAEAELAGDGRVLVRPSGTEPVVRVMVEAADAATARRITDELTVALHHALG